jgi:hypothetical protein
MSRWGSVHQQYAGDRGVETRRFPVYFSLAVSTDKATEPTMTNEVEVYFALKGDDLDPDAFTERSGITPSQVFLKGESGQYVKEYRFGMWKLSLGRIKGEVLLVCELAEQLVARLEGSADCIAGVVSEQQLYAVLEVVLYVSMDENVTRPALGFSSRTIAFLHKVGAEIDVDIYRN